MKFEVHLLLTNPSWVRTRNNYISTFLLTKADVDMSQTNKIFFCGYFTLNWISSMKTTFSEITDQGNIIEKRYFLKAFLE